MKTLSVILISLSFLSACNTKVKEENNALKAEIESLRNENISLKNGNVEITTSIESYKKTIDEINKNLASIDKTGVLIRKISPNGDDIIDESVNESIKQHIANITALLDNSRLKIIDLDKNLNRLRKESGNKSEEILVLDEKIQHLSNLILMKEQEFSDLEEGLRDEIEGLHIILEAEMELTDKLSEILNRAYYIVGTSKQLKDLGIIQKEGGFIGLGRVKVLNASAPTSLFVEIKKDQTNMLNLSCKKATLITPHSVDSYSFQGDTNLLSALSIDNPKEFWKNSNYLVIETNP
jgi:hypothetical protein